MRSKSWWWVALGVGLGCVAYGVVRLPLSDAEFQQASALAPPRRHVAPPPVVIPDPPPAEPSSEVPTLVQVSQKNIDTRIDALAREMADMWTRNPEELVVVIDDAARSMPSAPSVTLLLAIAHAETNGMILDVSEAGAVGLAQATPVAYHQEELDGKLFVTRDYLIGSRAYIMKKPLGDADTIASMLVDKDTPARRKKAKKLLVSAKQLRREGIDELDLLSSHGSQKYFADIRKMDEHNKVVLGRLGRLLDKGSRAQLRTFRNETRKEYRALKQLQLTSWVRYQKALIAKRDLMLEEHFGVPHQVVKRTMAYEASEYLGANLDDRFSAKSMARFLVAHLDRKAIEARKLARNEREVEGMTAALYNGGSHNVKRMLAGLIRTLPETEKYMRKVPATRRRLDSVISGSGNPVRTLR
ncbi:MAG TPA: hypothetical protein VGQ76_06655 [Thermoanaerobaculia bacterium]|jgi:hypothetical protein|nr:hypothetical protein [Thermoanaerobaculia bacterium]